jgi:DNA-damage-inducible protein J
MTENSVVRARIDEATKTEAAAVLAAMGLSLSDAFRLLLKRVAAEKARRRVQCPSHCTTVTTVARRLGGTRKATSPHRPSRREAIATHNLPAPPNQFFPQFPCIGSAVKNTIASSVPRIARHPAITRRAVGTEACAVPRLIGVIVS